jgi:hypothetical protein
MKATTMDSSEPPDSLSRTLRAWRVDPPRQPQFRAEVWQRLRGRPAAGSWFVYARQHATAVTGALTLALLAGAFLGREQARAHAAAERDQLATAYVQALDARAMQMP